LMPIIALDGDIWEKINRLKIILKNTAIGQAGLEELSKVFDYLKSFEIQHATLEFDVALARGLSYYTGCIFEVKVNNVQMGSISGGGRYDNLTGMFGLPDVSGVGFSFGVDRIYDVMEELQLFPTDQQTTTKVLIATFDEDAEKFALKLLQQLRQAGINSELYPESSKIKKQMSYADSKNIPFVVLIGSEEVSTQLLTLKNMTTGEQQKMTIDQVIDFLK
jgi:histidyl-tRNA synthetase